jgi:signal transduction histidine kinase
MSISTVNSSSDHHRPSFRKNAWERWIKIWHIVFYLTLILPTVLALSSGDLNTSAWVVFALSFFLGAWYGLVMIWLVPRLPQQWQSIGSMIYLAVALVVWFPLSQSYPGFYMTASSFYGLMWGTLPFGVAMAGNVILTVLIIWSQALNTGQSITLSFDLFLIGATMIGWSGLLALWMRSVMRESTERKRLIEQLEQAQSSLAEVEHQAGVLQERQRMAQEIHDTLAQSFTSIVMQLEAADQVLSQSETDGRNRIQRARETARAGLAEARRLVQALRPSQLENASLTEALARTTRRIMQETDLKIDFTVTGIPSPLHPDVEITLLRALQEGLTNIQKHAGASQVSVTLSYMEDQIALDIQDDGSGFDPEVVLRTTDVRQGGFGLKVMRSRVEQLGGEVILESSLGNGTTLAVQIPLETDG